MEAKFFKVLLVLLVGILGFTSCSDDDKDKEPLPLKFTKTKYEAPIGRSSFVSIASGNKDYDLVIGHPEVLEAAVINNQSIGYGSITITGKKLGETTITVTDKVTKESEILTIKVTDGYLPFILVGSNHPALEDNVWMFLVANEAKECYFFMNDNMITPLPDIISKGTYEFVVENDAPHLILTYAVDEKGKLTNATEGLEPHKFDLTGTNSQLLELFSSYLGADFGGVINKKSTMPKNELIMAEVDTEFQLIGSMQSVTIPEGILNKKPLQ